jgi:hypothetical protein
VQALVRALGLLTFGLAASWPRAAQAGNDDGLLVGGQAALTGGAITATISDGAAAWYNPAGVASSMRQTLDINASAYGVSLTKAHDVFTLPDGTTSSARVVDWQLVPTALSYTRRLSERFSGAVSVIIPSTTDVDLRTAISAADGTRWTLGIDQVRKEYDYIVSTGMRVSDQLRWGVSLHGTYLSGETLVQVGIGKPGDPSAAFESDSLHQTTGDYGLRIGLGVQWSPIPKLELGLAVQTPTLTGYRLIRHDEVAGANLGGKDGSRFGSSHRDELVGVWEFSTPFALRLGGALHVGRALLSVDGSLTSPIETSQYSLNRKLSGNGRLGALVQVTDKLAWGVGAFSDLNGARLAGPNFVGVTGGVRLSRHFTVAEGVRPLTFVTTLAGRYAYGWGHTQGLKLAGAGGSSTESTEVQLHVHEVALNLGGAVSF